MSRILTAALLALTLCAAAVPTMAGPDAYSDKRNPDPIICDVQLIESMAQVKDKVCKRKSEWARGNRLEFRNYAGAETGVPTMPTTP